MASTHLSLSNRAVIATVFFPPSEEYDQDGDGVADMGGEIDTNNLVRSFAVYGGEF